MYVVPRPCPGHRAIFGLLFKFRELARKHNLKIFERKLSVFLCDVTTQNLKHLNISKKFVGIGKNQTVLLSFAFRMIPKQGGEERRANDGTSSGIFPLESAAKGSSYDQVAT